MGKDDNDLTPTKGEKHYLYNMVGEQRWKTSRYIDVIKTRTQIKTWDETNKTRSWKTADHNKNTPWNIEIFEQYHFEQWHTVDTLLYDMS